MNITKGTVGTRNEDTSCPEMEVKRESNCVGGSFPMAYIPKGIVPVEVKRLRLVK